MSKKTEWLLALGVVVAAMFVAAEQKRQTMDMTTIVIYTPKK